MKKILLVLICFLFMNVVYASADVKIVDLEVSDKTSTIEVNSYSYEGLGIKTDIFFNQLGDYVKFKIKIKNNDNIDYIISDIKSNYSNEYTDIKYEYEDNSKEFKRNSEKIVYVTFKYTKEATDVTTLNGSQIVLTIPLDLENPKTGPDKALYILFIGIFLGAFVYRLTNRYKGALMVLAFFGLLFVSTLNAAQKLDIDLDINVTIDAESTNKTMFKRGMDIQKHIFELADMPYDTVPGSNGEEYYYLSCTNIESNSNNNFNIRRISNKYEVYSYTCSDAILKFERVNTIPETYKTDTYKVSTDDSTHPIYMWYDSNDKAVYWYSEAPIVYLNENANNMFADLEHISSLDLSTIRTKYTTTMNYLFLGMNDLTLLDISNFNTKNVTLLEYMFSGCRNLSELDISSFEINSSMHFDDNLLSDLESLERIKTPKSYNSNVSLALPVIFTNGENEYPYLYSDTPTSTWLQKTNKIMFKILDYSDCPIDGSPCESEEYTFYADEGMNGLDWNNSSYNTEGFIFANTLDTCPPSGSSVIAYNYELINGGLYYNSRCDILQ